MMKDNLENLLSRIWEVCANEDKAKSIELLRDAGNEIKFLTQENNGYGAAYAGLKRSRDYWESKVKGLQAEIAELKFGKDKKCPTCGVVADEVLSTT